MLADLRQFGARLRAFLRSDNLDRDLRQELDLHLDLLTADNIRRGWHAMAVGALVINPAFATSLADGTSRLIAAAAYDVLALALATGLSMFKPGAPFRQRHL